MKGETEGTCPGPDPFKALRAELEALRTAEWDLRFRRAQLLASAWIDGGRSQVDLGELAGLSNGQVSSLIAWADMVQEARRKTDDPDLRFSSDVFAGLRGWEWADALAVIEAASTVTGSSTITWFDVEAVWRSDPTLRRRYARRVRRY